MTGVQTCALPSLVSPDALFIEAALQNKMQNWFDLCLHHCCMIVQKWTFYRYPVSLGNVSYIGSQYLCS